MDDEPKLENPSPAPQTPPGPQGPKATSSSGLEPNVAALLSYVLGLITGIIFIVIEKDDKYVRFHAMQSIAFNVAIIVVEIALSIVLGILGALPGLGLAMIMLGAAVSGLLSLGIFVLWIILMLKAYQGEKFKLPIIGDYAEKQVG